MAMAALKVEGSRHRPSHPRQRSLHPQHPRRLHMLGLETGSPRPVGRSRRSAGRLGRAGASHRADRRGGRMAAALLAGGCHRGTPGSDSPAEPAATRRTPRRGGAPRSDPLPAPSGASGAGPPGPPGPPHVGPKRCAAAARRPRHRTSAARQAPASFRRSLARDRRWEVPDRAPSASPRTPRATTPRC